MSEVEDGVPAWIYSSKMEDMTLVLTCCSLVFLPPLYIDY